MPVGISARYLLFQNSLTYSALENVRKILRTNSENKLTDFSVQIGVKITHFSGRLVFNELLRFFTEDDHTITDQSRFQL